MEAVAQDVLVLVVHVDLALDRLRVARDRLESLGGRRVGKVAHRARDAPKLVERHGGREDPLHPIGLVLEEDDGEDPVGVTGVRVRVEGRTYFIDNAWPDSMHGIEFEGFDNYGKFWTPFHRDRA